MSKSLKLYQEALSYMKLGEEVLSEARTLAEAEAKKAKRDLKNITLTNKQAAALLDCCETTVWRMRKAGELKSLKINHVLEYQQENS